MRFGKLSNFDQAFCIYLSAYCCSDLLSGKMEEYRSYGHFRLLSRFREFSEAEGSQ